MPLSLDNDRYLSPPEVEDIDFEIEVLVTVSYTHTTTVAATSRESAQAILEQMQKQVIEDAVSANEHTDVEFDVQSIIDPRDR